MLKPVHFGSAFSSASCLRFWARPRSHPRHPTKRPERRPEGIQREPHEPREPRGRRARGGGPRGRRRSPGACRRGGAHPRARGGRGRARRRRGARRARPLAAGTTGGSVARGATAVALVLQRRLRVRRAAVVTACYSGVWCGPWLESD